MSHADSRDRSREHVDAMPAAEGAGEADHAARDADIQSLRESRPGSGAKR
jgi:hypothetical protein